MAGAAGAVAAGGIGVEGAAVLQVVFRQSVTAARLNSTVAAFNAKVDAGLVQVEYAAAGATVQATLSKVQMAAGPGAGGV